MQPEWPTALTREHAVAAKGQGIIALIHHKLQVGVGTAAIFVGIGVEVDRRNVETAFLGLETSGKKAGKNKKAKKGKAHGGQINGESWTHILLDIFSW